MVTLDRLASPLHLVKDAVLARLLDLFLQPPFPHLEILRLPSCVLTALLLVHGNGNPASAHQVEPAARPEPATDAAGGASHATPVIQRSLVGVREALLLER